MSNRVSGWSRRGSIAILAAVVLVVAGCGGGAGKARTLRIGHPGDVISLDPTKTVDGNSIYVISQIIEPLYRTDARGQIVPWLAQKGERAADGRTWTFDLRPGVRFSNGKPLTADDVVFSLGRVRKAPNWASMFAVIKTITAASPSRVTVTTKRPYAPMLVNLSLFAAGIVPKDFGGMSEQQFAAHPVGTGPFKFGSWTRGQLMTLKRNPDYWLPGKPELDQVDIHVVDKPNANAQLRGGRLDIIASPDWSQLAQLERTPHVKVGKYAMAIVSNIALNVRSRLFRDARVRQAVNLAIDRNAIVSAALGGTGKPGGGWLPPALIGHDANITPPARNVAEAKRLLNEATRATGVKPSFSLLLSTGDSYSSRTAQIVQQNLTEAGFQVKLQPLDAGAVYEQGLAGKYDAALMGAASDVIDPSELTWLYVSLKGLITQADTTEVTKLATQADAELDPARRIELYHRIQEVIQETGGIVTLNYTPWVFAYSTDVKGFSVNPTGIYWLADVSLDG